MLMESRAIALRPILVGAPALLGFLLIFGSTDLSPFELVAAAMIAITAAVVIARRLLVTYSARHYALAAFATLVLLQLAYVDDPNVTYALVTLYLIALYGAIQFWYASHATVLKYAVYGYLAGAVCSSLLGIAGYAARAASLTVLHDWFFWDSARVSVLYSDPVVYGAFLVPALLILSWNACAAETRAGGLLSAALALLVFANLILSGSRGAWLNFIVGGIVFFALYPPLRERAALVRAAVLSLLAFALAILLIYVIPLGDRTYYAATIENRYQASDGPRITHAKLVPSLLVNRPLHEIVLGSGSGMYERATPNGFSAHNMYIRTLYEQGIVGLAIFAAFLAFITKRAWIMRTERPLHVAIFLGALAGILAHGLFVDVIHWRHFWFMAALIV